MCSMAMMLGEQENKLKKSIFFYCTEFKVLSKTK